MVVNLVISMYQGARRLLVDGAVSKPPQGNLGLMAGCSFARDFLKAFLTPLTGGELKDQIRDYVDDVVVIQLGTGTTDTARGLKKGVTEVKLWMEANGLRLNETKEQVLGTSAALTRSRIQAGFPGASVKSVVTDLGV